MTEKPILADRRGFLKSGTLLATATALPGILRAQGGAGAPDEIKIALVGCGGRGSGAAAQSLNVPGTRLVAMADAFPDNIDAAHVGLKSQFGDRVDVPKERRWLRGL